MDPVMRRRRGCVSLGDRGFTLVEVLLGVVLLGALFAPLVAALSGSLTAVEAREKDTRALYLAQGRMEELLARDFDSLTPGSSLSDWVTLPDSVYRAVSITANPGGSFDANLKKITVTVGTTVLAAYRTNEFEP